jgi:hypothetical protein
MGMSMTFAAAPLCELTEVRKAAMKSLIATLEIDEFEESYQFYGDSDITVIREKLLEYVVEVCENFQNASKDVGWLCVAPMNYRLGITGAPSYGDSPTDSYDAFNAVACIEQVFDKLKEWAVEDHISY